MDVLGQPYSKKDSSAATSTEKTQVFTEMKIASFYDSARRFIETDSDLLLRRKDHTEFLLKTIETSFDGLSSNYIELDASRLWMCYWCLHSLDLLNVPIPDTIVDRLIRLAEISQSKEGGFGGGPFQLPHLASTYAIVNALVICGERGFSVINRKSLYQWLMRLKRPNGSFFMHQDGEVDVRGSYCALSVACLCNIVTDELKHNVAEFISSCQTYEGGIGSLPGMEAHGGYTFCGLATLVLIGEMTKLNLKRLKNWAIHRQMAVEGGFQGRTNKLVDSCYSFWQGALFSLLRLDQDCGLSDVAHDFDASALQRYILICCQEISGGIKDKPGKYGDLYHTCYALSGLSIAQHQFLHVYRPHQVIGVDSFVLLNSTQIEGHKNNLISPTHPVFNLRLDRVVSALCYFRSLEFVI